MPSLLIIEPHCEGHHMQHVRWVAQEAVASGCKVILATSAYCLDHPSYLALQKGCGEHLRPVLLPRDRRKPDVRGTLALVELELRYYGMFRSCYRRLSKDRKPDYVFVPFLDYCLYAASLLGSPFGDTPWGGIALRPRVEEADSRVRSSWMQQAKKKLFFRFLRSDKSLRVLFSPDETLIRYAQQKSPESAKRLRFLPDPAEFHGSHSRVSARRMLGIPDEAVVALVYGVLDRRKGIDALLAAVREEGIPEEVALLVTGRQDAEVRSLLASPQARSLRKAGRLYEIDRFLQSEEEHAVFQAADMVWLGYRGHYGSSGVLVQAAATGLPVVACDEGLIGWLTREHGLGLTVSIEDTPAVAGAISELVRDPGLAAKCGANGKRFFLSRSVEYFGQVIREEMLSSLLEDNGE